MARALSFPPFSLISCSLQNCIYNHGGHSRFQKTGMIKGFFWVQDFWFRDFYEVGKSGTYLFGVAWFKQGFFGGTQNNPKICGSARVSQPHSSANKVLHKGSYIEFWFLLPFDYPHHLKSGVPLGYIYRLWSQISWCKQCKINETASIL